MTKHYREIFYKSSDGLRLFARDYAPVSIKPVVLCLHGLTRNSADFHDLAVHLSDRFRVICVDQRGRGRSAYDDNSEHYHVTQYCEDMFTLLDYLKLSKIMIIGTSMGGIMAMLMARANPDIFSAVILNDIGPEIDPKGLARIKSYVGAAHSFDNLQGAVEALKAQGPKIFPEYTNADWTAFAKRTCRPTNFGKIVFDYDPAISKPIMNDDSAAAPVDMWPMFKALYPIPTLIIRGALSDLLSVKTAQKMVATHPNAKRVDIANIGHAPMLSEPQSITAIDHFLEDFT